MQFQVPFDARTVEPASFAPPPPLADYHVRITNSEPKATKDESGGYLELTLEILDPGPYLNRKIPYRLNLFNKNTQTCEIAYRQLSAVCHVVGVFNVQDSRQLWNIPFIATIGPQTNAPTYPNVFDVKDINGNAAGKTPAATGVTAIPPAAPPPPAYAPAPAAAAPPAWQPPAPAWQPPAPAAAAAPPWGPPAAAAPPAAPVWSPPGAAPPAAAAPAAAPAWQPGAAPPAAPPWAK
jgi:Protein of unknown function (DUF669)